MFEKYGGFSTCRKIVSAFYDQMLDSPVLSHHFVGIDMARLIDHQTKFVTFIMGGPAHVSDEHLAKAHRPLRISGAEFTEMTEILRDALEDHDLEPEDVAFIIQEVRKRSHLIVY